MFEIPVPILILQHPQEPSRRDQEASSAQVISELIHPSHVATGLSWRSLTQATQKFEAISQVEDLKKPALWATLYLGTQKQGQAEEEMEPGIYYLDKKGNPTEPPANAEVGGLILLDGTWSQAKTLWWRNAWLLKTQRIYIVPKTKSLYGKVRKEPRPECVSTAEAAAETLSFLGIDPAVEIAIKENFKSRLQDFKKKLRSE